MCFILSIKLVTLVKLALIFVNFKKVQNSYTLMESSIKTFSRVLKINSTNQTKAVAANPSAEGKQKHEYSRYHRIKIKPL